MAGGEAVGVGVGGKIPWPGQLAPTPRKHDRTLFRIILFLLNKNLYDRYMETLIFMCICIFYPIGGN